MSTLRRLALAAMPWLAIAIGSPAVAADGDLDPDFGAGGIAYLSPDLVSAQELQPFAVTTLADGKILIGGSLDTPTAVPFEQTYRGMFARFNADGSVDETFGNSTIAGVVALPNLSEPARLEGIESMSVLQDGALVAVGVSHVDAPLNGFLIKTSANGELDTSFGDGGKVMVGNTFLHAVGIDSEGRIVAAGEHIDGGVYTSSVLRFNADGSPDQTFGADGLASIGWDGAGNSGYLSDLLIDADDGITVGGFYSVYGDGLGNDFAIARLDASGTLDAGFGDGGSRVFHDPTDASFVNAINRLAATPDGGIAFAGYYLREDSSTALILGHLAADGTTDASFGDAATPGYFRPAIVPTAQSVTPTKLLTQPDGKLLVAISYFVGEPEKENFVAVRATASGALDPSFADGGVFEVDLAPAGTYSDLSAMTLQPDGRIVLAGRTERSDEFLVDIGVVRLLNTAAPSDGIFADGFDPAP